MKTIKAISIFLAVATFALSPLATLALDPPKGQASYTYDENNRLTKVVYSNARTVTFTYDNNGNLKNVATSGGTTGIFLKDGTALTGISGSEGGNRLYTFVVPATTPAKNLLEIKTYGGTGDCDLEVSDSGGVHRYSLNPGNSETIKISDPTPGTWMVNLIFRTNVSGLSVVAKTYSGAPLAPAGLKATDGTFADKIVLTWTEAAGSSSYLVYRNETASHAGETEIAEVEDTTFTDIKTPANPLDPAKTYTYFVKSKRATTASTLYSAGDAGYLTRKPSPPATVAASDGTYFDKIRITWSAVIGASSYDVERYSDAGLTNKEITFADITDLYYDDGTCDLKKTYYYAVIAKNANGSSLKSKGNAGILSSKGPATITATSGTIYNKIKVTWAAVPGATSYGIYIDNSATENDSTILPTYDFIKTDPGWATDHSFKVRAKYAANQSDFSPAANGKFGNLPATLATPVIKSVSKGDKSIKVVWGTVPFADEYVVMRNIVGNSNVELLPPTSNTFYDDTGAQPGVIYNYRIFAYCNNRAVQSVCSAGMTGYAEAAPIAPLTSGTPVTLIDDIKGGNKFYSIIVPTGTTRLVASLTGTTNAILNDCDLYLKLESYPTKTSYNAKGTESASGETAIVTNPVPGTWYVMLNAVTAYSGVTLKVDCYSASDIILTQVPLNNQTIPFTAAFKGRVIDEVGAGIPGLNIKVGDPINGKEVTLSTKTDASGYFTYSTTVNMEGEHTYAFYFDEYPDTAKGTAGHTVSTRIGASVGYPVFDSSSYLPATPVALANQTDITGMQTFLKIRNGWDPAGIIDSTYEDMWVNSTVIKTPSDEAITNKGTDGLFIVFYGFEGAGAGNDKTANPALSTVPLVLHVTPGASQTAVLDNLETWGMISTTRKDEINSGNVGLLAIAVLKDPDEIAGAPTKLSLLADDEFSLISDFVNNSANTTIVGTADYSTVTTTIFTINLNGDDTKKISIVAVAY